MILLDKGKVKKYEGLDRSCRIELIWHFQCFDASRNRIGVKQGPCKTFLIGFNTGEVSQSNTKAKLNEDF